MGPNFEVILRIVPMLETIIDSILKQQQRGVGGLAQILQRRAPAAISSSAERCDASNIKATADLLELPALPHLLRRKPKIAPGRRAR